MTKHYLWGLLVFPIVVILGLLLVLIRTGGEPRPGRACYTRTLVRPFSNNIDTVDVQVCFRGTGAP